MTLVISRVSNGSSRSRKFGKRDENSKIQAKQSTDDSSTRFIAHDLEKIGTWSPRKNAASLVEIRIFQKAMQKLQN
jgi:hypothetical protein